MKPVVIARFSIFILTVQLAVAAVLGAFLCRSFLPPEVFAVLAVALIGLGVYRRKAIWIENNRLFLRNTPLMFTHSLAIGDVEDVQLGQENVWPYGWQWTGVIVIKLRGGRKITVGQYPLMPSLRIALSRLREALGLPEATT